MLSALPSLPKYTKDNTLIVVLTVWPEDSRKDRENILKGDGANWQRNLSFIYCHDNRFQRQLERIQQAGSIEQIYNIATRAKTLGWKRLIVVDALSDEQLSGNVRHGRSKVISVVYVQINGTKGLDIYKKAGRDVNVMAKRMKIDEARDALRERKPISFEIPLHHHILFVGPQAYYNAGILLYDPAKSVYDKTIPLTYDPNEIACAVEQVLSLDPLLPPEIVSKIFESAEEELDLETMTAAPAKLIIDSKRLDIHLLIPLYPQEIDAIQAEYNKEMDNTGTRCSVYPWIASRPANRRELWRMFQRVCANPPDCGHTLFLFAGWPGWDKNAELGLMCWNNDKPPSTRRLSVREAAEAWHKAYDPNRSHRRLDHSRSLDDPAFELMLDPNGRFFWDPPPFVSLNTDRRPPVFFLTKMITDGDTSFIESELSRTGKHDEGRIVKRFTFIEWESDADGTEEDMWRLLWKCHTHRGEGRTSAVLFVDLQSTWDRKVIVAEILYDTIEDGARKYIHDDVYGPIIGMQYGRQLACEAVAMLENPDRMTFGEFFSGGYLHGKNEEYHKYLRPGAVWEDSVPG